MEKKNQKIIIFAVIIVVLIILCILFATKTISFGLNNAKASKDINIEILSIEEIGFFGKDAQNEKMFVKGKMNLSYKSDDFIKTAMTGYCIGKNNEKYSIHPGSGWVKYYDNENNFTLVNTISNSDVVYPNGTTKPAKEIDWEKVEIKSCVIEKFNALTNDSESISIDLNFKEEL